MAVQNITQLRRIVFRKWDATESTWDVFTLEPDDLGQDTVMTINVAPRMRSRASSLGSTETAISGTLDSFAGSITFLMDTFKNLGQAIQKWNQATYEGAGSNAGNIIWDGTDICAEGEYMSVIAQGLCDDGSSVDVELTRCIPSVDDDIEIGTGDTPTITLNLHPIIYNSTLHATDGYPQYSARLGDYDLTTKMRLNASTGIYAAPASA
ncbi:hypothetical protein [Fibrobacter sp.]|uniref:hypothetical protein n=1 Tax=Fibrobacter sp. TaxID=35828 RepID=UPI00388D4859